MRDFDELRRELEYWKNYPRKEINLSEIERGLFRKLGIERVETGKGKAKKGKGSQVTYYHPLLKQLKPSGYMVIHKLHKARNITLRYWFVDKMYKQIRYIIDQLEMEETREREKR